MLGLEQMLLYLTIACIGTFIVILLATQIGRKNALVLLVGHFLSFGFLLAFAQLCSNMAGLETRRQFESVLLGMEIMIEDGEASKVADAIVQARRPKGPTSPLELGNILREFQIQDPQQQPSTPVNAPNSSSKPGAH